MPKLRVLVVDDAVVMRRLISEALARDPDIEIVGAAANGKIALQMIPQVNPDIVTLDVEMPEMDGIATVRELRKSWPKLPVIMFSTLTERAAAATLDALAAGATDYVTKPANVGKVSDSFERLQQELIPKIKLHCRGSASAKPAAPATTASTKMPVIKPGAVRNLAPFEMLCIGSSTGGPNALAEIFSHLTAPLHVPVVIVQHMPVLFTKMLAERLDKVGPVRFREAADGDMLKPNLAYIAPGGRHMEIVSAGLGFQVRLTDTPPENSCRPAVDVLFRSVAITCRSRVLGVILTGMGQDGLNGCHHLHERGNEIITQDEASSVVWGMPGAVTRAGIAHHVFPLSQIAPEITRRFAQFSRPKPLVA